MKPTPLLLPAIALLATYVLAASAAAMVNFAQFDQAVAPAPGDARRLTTYFSPPYQAGPMPPDVEKTLLRDAPADLRAGCAATVDRFGPAARDSSQMSLRILAVAGGSAWLAYRCDSRALEFDGRYSERLAVFNTARRVIQFLDLTTSDDTADTLYHVGLAETVKMCAAENSAAFEVFAISPSPDRAAPPRQTENRFVVIANSPSRARPALSVVTARQRPVTAGAAPAATPGVLAGDAYRAAIRFDHDLTGNLTAVVAYYRDGRSRSGVTRYVWTPAAFRFAVARPIPLPPVGEASPGQPPEQPPVPLPPAPVRPPLAN